MSAGPTRGEIRQFYTKLQTGREFWHVHPTKYGGDSFNAHTKGRFSGIEADPPREMYYAGTTPECALWEVTLRDVAPSGNPVVSIDAALYSEFQIARVQLKRDTPVLDLRPPNIRNLSEVRERWNEWQRLSVASEREYPRTHEVAAELLAAAPQAAGLMWHSRQCGQDTTIVMSVPKGAHEPSSLG